MRFPKYFPKRCPPADCSEATGTYYRAIEGNSPVEKDFLPHWLLKPYNQHVWIKAGQACIACGLSVNRNIEDLKKKIEIWPVLRNRNIAEGTLSANMGKVKAAPSVMDPSHHTWWVPSSIKDPSSFFKIVA